MIEYIAPSVKVIANSIDFAEDLIKLAESAPERWSNSRIGVDKETNYDVRSSNELHIPWGIDYPPEFFLLAQKIYVEARTYANENGFEFSHMEGLNLLRYTAREGYYDRHIDFGPSNPRVCSALLYLNDVEEGGGTWFDKFDLLIRPEEAKLVLFPANYAYSHAAMPPVSNDKYVVVTWFGIKQDEDVFEKYYADYR